MIRRNPSPRRRRSRRRYRYSVSHVIRRIRANPAGDMGKIGGVIAGQLAFSVVNGLVVTKAISGSTTFQTASSRTMASIAVSGALGAAGYYGLRKSYPNLAVGIAAAAVTALVLEGLVAAGFNLLGSATTAAAGAAAAGTGGAAGTGTAGTAGTNLAMTSPTAASPAAAGAAAYLGANPRRRRRRMAAYLGANARQMRWARGMGVYLQPGQNVSTLIPSPASPTGRTFGRGVASLGNLYTGGSAFKNAWQRN